MRFLAFEGLDGSGKSTLIQGLKNEFAVRGQSLVISREPGGTELGSEIRAMLLRIQGVAPVPKAEALLYQADRAHHVETLIRPALSRGDWVLTDRFEREQKEFHEKVRAAYLDLARLEPDRWFTLSGEEKPAELLRLLLEELKRRQWLA